MPSNLSTINLDCWEQISFIMDKACREGDIETMVFLKNENVVFPNTLLSLAVENKQTEMYKWIFLKGLNLGNFENCMQIS